MRIDPKYKIRNIAGEEIVLMEGSNGVNMTKVIALNPSSSWLWKELEGKDFDQDSATDILCSHYDVEREIAAKDVSSWIKTLKDNKIIL